ncbi:hypothetical protein [Agromyces sp. LHK192]|uniref:hypothetical protein n=1 Tax=Agromyces sp. LHK192 TaxID=2498704 RepID=UPI000FD9B25E|nr:hypothetical protein [Agromyces sp. LHK192]
MIARPSVLADSTYRPLTEPDAAAEARAVDALAAAGLDPALAVANVVRRGGRERAFRAALGAGVSMLADAADGRVTTDAPGVTLRPAREALLDVAALAGWRAGVVALREDALARCEAMRFAEGRARVAAAVLGLEAWGASAASGASAISGASAASGLDEFLDRQATDRYWWPGRSAANGFVWSVGGFAGFGDAWVAPPEQWHPLDATGGFAVFAAGEWWRVDGDVWGGRCARAEADEASDLARDRPAAVGLPGVNVVLRTDTHLAWLWTPEPG